MAKTGDAAMRAVNGVASARVITRNARKERCLRNCYSAATSSSPGRSHGRTPWNQLSSTAVCLFHKPRGPRLQRLHSMKMWVESNCEMQELC